MKTKFFQHTFNKSILLFTAISASLVCGEGKLTLAQPTPQATPSVGAQSNVNSGQTPGQQSAPSENQTTVSTTSNKPVDNAQNITNNDDGSKKVASPAYWIVLALIVLLALLFSLLIWWSSKLEQASYLGTLFRDTVEEIEYRRLSQPYVEKFTNYGYHAHANRDPNVQAAIRARLAKVDRAIDVSGGAGSASSVNAVRPLVFGTGPPGLKGTGSGSGYDTEVEERANLNYQADLDKARAKAKVRAKQAASVDLNVLRGRGAEFVLEFTAVVFLVFAVTILGLLEVLKSEPIATLLAAIAGYVLGRASTRKPGQGEGTRSGVSTAEVIELVRAVQGNAKPATKAAKANKEEADESSEAEESAPAAESEQDKADEEAKH